MLKVWCSCSGIRTFEEMKSLVSRDSSSVVFKGLQFCTSTVSGNEFDSCRCRRNRNEKSEEEEE